MRIKVKVKPNSRENSVKLIEPGKYEVKVTAPPEKGMANKMVIVLIAKHLKIPKSKISILSGETYKEKVIEIND